MVSCTRAPISQTTVSETRPLDQCGLVLSGDYRDRLPHLGSLPEKLNHTPHQEKDIRNPEKYGKAELATSPPLPVLAECPGRVQNWWIVLVVFKRLVVVSVLLESDK
jgi:hypothetical protein